jgi:DNA-binding beta-propeller fold protein YncE
MRLMLRTLLALSLTLTFSTPFADQAYAAPQKKNQKKKKKSEANAPPTVKLEVVKQQEEPAPQQAQSKEPLLPDKDPQRQIWRITVEPYAILGSGRPGKAATDFDKPDGVGFTPNGWLLATDAKNRRVQIWDVKTKTYLGEFGHGIFGGEIVDVAVSPNGTVLVTDQTLNLAYAFEPPKPGAKDEKGKPLGPYDYQFRGTRFGEQGFDKLGGIAIDSKERIYVVDAHLNDVRRFKPDGTVDPAWKFEKARGSGDTYLHGCEGIAIDEAQGNLFIASEKDAVIQVFDFETGAYKGKMVGAKLDASGAPAGTHVFSGSVEGLALANNHLFAVDESAGHIQVFDILQPNLFNTDLTAYRRNGAYKGFFGHAPLVNFDDKTNKTLQQQVKDGAVIPGQANPPGYFCSPDAIASYTDKSGGETYIAIADQCNYRLAVYRWSEISKAMSPAVVAKTTASGNQTAVSEKAGKKKGKKKNP